MFANKEAGLFKALSDGTRLSIVKLLLRKELCVCEITKKLKLSQPKISRHLSYLRNNTLVKSRKKGSWQHYRLNRGPVINRKIFSLLKNMPKERQ